MVPPTRSWICGLTGGPPVSTRSTAPTGLAVGLATVAGRASMRVVRYPRYGRSDAADSPRPARCADVARSGRQWVPRPPAQGADDSAGRAIDQKGSVDDPLRV